MINRKIFSIEKTFWYDQIDCGYEGFIAIGISLQKVGAYKPAIFLTIDLLLFSIWIRLKSNK